MARRADPAVKVLGLLEAMSPEVRQTVLALARDKFRGPVAQKVVRRARAKAVVQMDPAT